MDKQAIKHAVSLLMAARRRAWVSPERRTFPKFTPGMTTAKYVKQYYNENSLGEPFTRTEREYRHQGYDNATRRPINAGYFDVVMPGYLVRIDRPAPMELEQEEALAA